MIWTREAWREIAPIHSRILAHPFLAGLANGTLPHEIFLFYLAQDSLYLDDFGKVLAGLAPGAPSPDDTRLLAGFAAQAVEVERELHRSYLQDLELPDISPTCQLYTSWLYKKLARGPWEVALAAVLPCFWIYLEAGDHLVTQSPMGSANPYQPWIDTYGGEEYAASVRYAMAMADRAADSATSAVRARMTDAFIEAARLEWMFWDSAWNLEAWPF